MENELLELENLLPKAESAGEMKPINRQQLIIHKWHFHCQLNYLTFLLDLEFEINFFPYLFCLKVILQKNLKKKS